jgi:hypothetical protein
MQGPSFSQLDIGVNYHIDPVSVGVFYRGKPFQKSVINTPTQDAVILTLGCILRISTSAIATILQYLSLVHLPVEHTRFRSFMSFHPDRLVVL